MAKPKQKSTIAFVSAMERTPWGGSEELWYGAAKYLSDDSNRLLISYKHWEVDSARNKLSIFQNNNHAVQWRKPPTRLDRWLNRVRNSKLWPELESFQKFLTKNKPVDLMCVSQGNFRDGAWAMEIARSLNIPYVTIVQANAEFLWPSDELCQSLIPLYQQAKRVYCVSQANLNLLQNQLAINLPQAEVIFNPFNVPWEQSFHWPDETNGYHLACVARLEPDAKGQDLILQTLALPEWRERPLTVHFYGTGAAEQSVKRLADRYGLKEPQVLFHGQVADVTSIWEKCHGLLLTSRYEGLPLALVEAMLCGRTPIVTDIAGAAELVEDQKNGYLITAPKLECVAETLEHAWAQRKQWQALGKAAQETARKKLPADPCKVLADKLVE